MLLRREKLLAHHPTPPSPRNSSRHKPTHTTGHGGWHSFQLPHFTADRKDFFIRIGEADPRLVGRRYGFCPWSYRYSAAAASARAIARGGIGAGDGSTPAIARESAVRRAASRPPRAQHACTPDRT